MMQVGKTKAGWNGFDRKYTADKIGSGACHKKILPSTGFSSEKKYEKDGGPGIAEIMSCLLGSASPEQDRYTFMKAQVLFWLLAATDGHAKFFYLYRSRGAIPAHSAL